MRHPCLLLALTYAVGMGCGSGAAGPGDARLPIDSLASNSVVPGTSLINVLAPALGCVTSTSPGFAWVATGRSLVMLGVFVENIDVRQQSITNPEANVWAWHTGLGLGREGNVSWQDGITVQDGEFRPDIPLQPLPPNTGFNWAIWAWDHSGLAITHSSPEMFFSTGASPADITCP